MQLTMIETPKSILTIQPQADYSDPPLIQFKIYGKIIANKKVDVRIGYRKNGSSFPILYTRTAVRQWKEAIRAIAIQHKPDVLLTGPLMAFYRFHILMPKSKRRKDTSLEPYWIDVKPDNDNLIGIIQDAIQGIIYDNDSRIAETRIQKIYTKEAEYVDVAIWKL